MQSLFPKDAGALERRLLVILLVAFVLTAGMYSVVAPLFEGSDELLHFRVVHQLASGGPLPVLDAENLGPWGSEAFQPPLYYALAAAATFWVDTSDLERVLIDNPHHEVRIVDGNLNILLHDWRSETLPWRWRGTVLAGHLVRLLSVALSVGSVYVAYRLGLELLPRQRWLALAGAAAMAFTPMFAYVSGSVNNDTASVLLSTLSLWQMARIVRSVHGARYTRRMALRLGLLLGLAALAKVSTLGLFALAGLTMAYASYRLRRWPVLLVDGLLVLGIAAAIAGWWYWRNYRLYGDPLALDALLDVVGHRPPSSQPILRLWAERRFTIMSYWGMFASASLPMADWTYDVLIFVTLVALAGLIVALVRRYRRDGLRADSWLPLALAGLWVLVIGVSLVRYGDIHNTPEGRHAFPAIGVLSLGLVAGLGGSLPRRAGQAAVGALLGFLVTLTWSAPFVWILPQYRPPAPLDPQTLTSTSSAFNFYEPDEAEPAMRLLEYDVSPGRVQPGDNLRVAMTWQVTSKMERNWSVFVHLADEYGIIVTQRDSYPGRGSLGTTLLDEGFTWREEWLLPVPQEAYTPDEARLELGLYDADNGERMTLVDAQDNAVVLGEVDIAPLAGATVPNPLGANFGGEIELAGYEMSPRAVLPGETLNVDLYWRGLTPTSRDYTVFVHILGDQNRIWAGSDAQPAGGQMPTSTWEPGQLVRDSHTLTLDPSVSPGVYPIEVGIYWLDESGNFNRLEHLGEGGQVLGDFVLLSPLAVLP